MTEHDTKPENGTPLEQACLAAMTVYLSGTGQVPTLDDIRKLGSAERMELQLASRTFQVESLPAPEDMSSFLCTLMALRRIAAGDTNYDRTAAARLLRTAANQIELYAFAEPTSAVQF